MSLKFYNTATRTKEDFIPLRSGEVGMYVCGVTVYDLCHIGHARSAIVFDVLVKYLRARGFLVTYVRNFTDVDDKIIDRANQLGKEPAALADQYIRAFYEDMGKLGIVNADKEPRATEHIQGMIDMIVTLIEKGFAYVEGTDVFYSVETFSGYGELSGRRLEDMKAGSRIAVDEKKRHPMDFVLWKGAKPGEPQWDSPWGRGWPGWHSECAAMAIRHLGPEFDLHVGGIDLRFPHHENSRALATVATGKRFAALWLHAAHLLVDGKKMSKSARNEYTLDDLETGPPGGGKGFSAADFRYYCMTLHYATPMNFTWVGQAAAARARSRLLAAFRRAALAATSGEDAAAASRLEFREAISDDLNMPRALAVVHKVLRSGIGGEAARALATEWDAVLGAGMLSEVECDSGVDGVREGEAEEIPAEVAAMAQERESRRRAGDYPAADALRERIRAAGYDVLDAAGGAAVLRKIG